MAWEGVHTALVTPFHEDGSLDSAAYEALLQRQIEGGVQGIVPCGTTGETPTLDVAEWAWLVERAVAARGGAAGLKVTAGVGTNNTRSTVARVEQALHLGADAGLLVLPYYNKPNPAGLRAHVAAALAPGLPLIVYHVPGRTGQRLSPELLAELCDLPGVVACKEATGDLTFGQDLALKTATPLLSGDDFTWLPLLSVGGAGVISVLSNLAPKGTVAVWRAWQAGDTATAAALHRALYPTVSWLFSTTSPIPAKAGLAHLGLCRPDCRLPLVGGHPVPGALVERWA